MVAHIGLTKADQDKAINTGANIGAFAGGIVGAFVGAAIGGAVAASKSKIVSFHVPICESCKRALRPQEISNLGDANFDPAAPPCTVYTQYLTKKVEGDKLILTFANPQYGDLLYQSNESFIFKSMAAYSARTKKQAKELRDLDNNIFSAMSRDEIITGVLKSFLPLPGLYVAPDIPDKKLSNARKACLVPAQERIIGLIDCTLWGSAKNGILFGGLGIYYHYGEILAPHREGRIPYQNLLRISLKKDTSLKRIELGNDQYFDCSSSSVGCDVILNILESVKDSIKQSGL